jgi:hypothetical protein
MRRLVGAGAVQAVGNRVVDPVRLELGVQRVPMARFIGMQLGARPHNLGDEIHTIGLLPRHGPERAALALASDHDHAALAGLVLRQSAINAVLFAVPRPAGQRPLCSRLRASQPRPLWKRPEEAGRAIPATRDGVARTPGTLFFG